MGGRVQPGEARNERADDAELTGVRGRAEILAGGARQGELTWLLTDDLVLTVEWRGRPLRGFRAWEKREGEG